MERTLVRARFWLAALACGGVAGAHRLAYYVSSPHHEVDEALVATGHDYWPYFAPLAVAALLAGFSRFFIDGYRNGRGENRQRFWVTALILWAFQTSGFLTLEVAERMLFAPGHSLNVFNEAVVLWGLAFQVLAALLATIAIRLLTHAGKVISRMRNITISCSSQPVLRMYSQTRLVLAAPATGGSSLRAPPTLH